MRTRLLAAAVLAAVALPQPASAADADVTVEHLTYLPGKVRVGLGETVTWTFPEVTQHTTTSDQGFWDSGARSGGATYVRTFTSAGRFAYHCTFHPSMHGSVAVGLRVVAPSVSVRAVRWSTVKGAGGTTFDVQVKVGSGPWRALLTDTKKPRAKIAVGSDPVKVRARTSKGGEDSGWSRAVRLT
ncbi:plastocyanin/azurin family copper-binding protein [Nocardioides dilutus]